MREQISPNAWIHRTGNPGPTRNPLQPQLDQAMSQYEGMTREQCRQALEDMGALDPDRARGRVWDRLTFRERAMFIDIAGHRGVSMEEKDWSSLAPETQRKVWAVIRNAATWGDTVRERMQ